MGFSLIISLFFYYDSTSQINIDKEKMNVDNSNNTISCISGQKLVDGKCYPKLMQSHTTRD